MYKIHTFVNGSAPYINAQNLNEMDLGIASGCTYVATCTSAANANAKAITISDFVTATMTDNPGIPFVLYVLFANGSTSDSMTIAINGGTARNVRYRNSTTGIGGLQIAANDLVAFVYNSGIYYLLGAIASPLTLLNVEKGGTGRSSLTANAVLAGNGTSAVKQIGTVSGALYATGSGGAPTFGTLPVAQGGTGSTSAANARIALGVPTITHGTGTPSGGRSGDVYIQHS